MTSMKLGDLAFCWFAAALFFPLGGRQLGGVFGQHCSAPLRFGQPFLLIRLLGCIGVGDIGEVRGI
jgi:hypothetical protein